MSDRLPGVDRTTAGGPVRRLTALAALAALLGLASAFSGLRSDDKTTEEKPIVKPTERSPSTLFVLVHVKGKMLDRDVCEKTFEESADLLGIKGASVKAEVLEPQFYRTLHNLTKNLGTVRDSIEPGKPIVRQRGGEDVTEWDLSLNTAGFVLGKLELAFADKEGKTATRILTPDKTGKPEAALRPTMLQGVYIVRLPTGDVPSKFTARGKLYKEKGGSKEHTISGPWSDPERYYLVVLRNFTGDHKALLEKATDKTKNGPTNPLDSAVAAEDLTLVFASAGFQLKPRGPSIVGNRWIPVVPILPERNVKRVWIRFPLSRKEAADQSRKYGRMAIGALSKAIRDEKPIWAEDNPKVTLSADDPPRWIELPFNKKLAGFSREVELKGIAAVAKKHPDAHWLLVYEGGSREKGVIVVVSGGTQDKGERVIGEAVKEWPSDIAAAAAREKTKR